MRLKVQDLPAKLLSRLRSLERWDLSGNRLQELPKNLELPALRYLDLSDNQMEDVTTLESLSSLEELKMEDNLYITVRTWLCLLLIVHSFKGDLFGRVITCKSHDQTIFGHLCYILKGHTIVLAHSLEIISNTQWVSGSHNVASQQELPVFDSTSRPGSLQYVWSLHIVLSLCGFPPTVERHADYAS